MAGGLRVALLACIRLLGLSTSHSTPSLVGRQVNRLTEENHSLEAALERAEREKQLAQEALRRVRVTPTLFLTPIWRTSLSPRKRCGTVTLRTLGYNRTYIWTFTLSVDTDPSVLLPRQLQAQLDDEIEQRMAQTPMALAKANASRAREEAER